MSATHPTILTAVAGLLLAVACGPGDGGRAADAARAAALAPRAAAVASAGDLRVAVLEVARAGDSMIEVRFTVTNAAGGGAPVDIADRFAAGPDDRGTVADVYLVDAAAQKKYFVIRDARGRPACSTAIAPLAPGETRHLWARFLAPPPKVSRIGVRFPPAPSTLEVPISRSPSSGESSGVR